MAASASSATQVSQERVEILIMNVKSNYGEEKSPPDPIMTVLELVKMEALLFWQIHEY